MITQVSDTHGKFKAGPHMGVWSMNLSSGNTFSGCWRGFLNEGGFLKGHRCPGKFASTWELHRAMENLLEADGDRGWDSRDSPEF